MHFVKFNLRQSPLNSKRWFWGWAVFMGFLAFWGGIFIAIMGVIHGGVIPALISFGISAGFALICFAVAYIQVWIRDGKRPFIKDRRKTIVWIAFMAAIFVGVMFCINFPRYSKILRKIDEGSPMGNFGLIQSAISIYAGDHDGDYPADLKELVPKYIDRIPTDCKTGSSKVVREWDGTGGWVYDSRTGVVNFNLLKEDKPLAVPQNLSAGARVGFHGEYSTMEYQDRDKKSVDFDQVAAQADLTAKVKPSQIRNRQEAVAVAESVLFPIYGKEHILNERPYSITETISTYRLRGTLQNKMVGGTFDIVLRKADGKVVSVTHYK